MSTTLNNILRNNPGKPATAHVPPGIDSSIEGAAAVQGQQAPLPPLPKVAEKPQQQAGQQAAAETGQQPKKGLGLVEIVQKLNPEPSEEQKEKERKKKKREQIFAAIGDGISALSNLYFASQYAPNMYSGANSASQRTNERWEKLAAERNANMKAYIDLLMRATQGDADWQRQLGLDKMKQERDQAADARAEAEEKRKEELHPFAKRKAEGDAQAAEARARHADEYEQSRIGRNKAAAGASDAAAGASRARAHYYNSGGGGSGGRYYGELYGKQYKTQADYEKAVLDAAKENGLKLYEEEIIKPAILLPDGRVLQEATTRREDRPIADIAAELEAIYRKNKKKPNPMGAEGGNGKKPNPMS